MEKVRYAMIGFGGIAENRIAKEGFACDVKRFKSLEHAVLKGAFDLNPARKSAAAALGLKWYDSIDAILADKEIDAVYIATNNASHAKLTLKALEAGKHVLVEKPLATSPEDGRAMVKMAARKHLSLGVDHMMVNNAYHHMAKKYVESGKLGKVDDCCFHMEFAYGYAPAEAASWRCSKVEEMGGPIGDVASHCFYVAEFIFGSKIKSLCAAYLPKVMSIKAEDGAYIKFFMENGMSGSVKVAFSELRGSGLVSGLSCQGFEIYGNEGCIRSYGTMMQFSGLADEPYHIHMDFENAKGVKAMKPRKFNNIYQVLVENHAKSILSGKLLNAEDGLHNIKLCQTAHKSAKAGGKIYQVK